MQASNMPRRFAVDASHSSMPATHEQVIAGQAVYTKQVLSTYDSLVLGVSNALLWRCPTRRLVELYNKHVTANHLDVGVGTGYFLDNCRFPSPMPRVALMDLNQNALDFASKRIARYKPEAYRCNVLDPMQVEAPKFDSVALNYLLHCLPGTIESKAIVFDRLKALMNPKTVIFGATLLQRGVARNLCARRLMDIYNKRGIFSNHADHLDGLEKELRKRFKDVSIEVVGCAALFSGRVRSPTGDGR
jgi:hypothetical protein